MSISMVPHNGVVDLQHMEKESRKLIKELEIKMNEAKNEMEYTSAVFSIIFQNGAHAAIIEAMKCLEIPLLAEIPSNEEDEK